MAAPVRKAATPAAATGRARGGATRAVATAAPSPTKTATKSPAKATSAAKRRPVAKGAKPVAVQRRPRWSWPTLRLGETLRRDIVAIGLVVLALLTIWSLFGERDGLLGLWNQGLRRMFGWASVFVPVALIAWVIDSFRVQLDDEGRPSVGLHRRHFIGTALIFVTILGVLHLPATDALAQGRAGEGGGILGYLITAPLVAAVRPVGTAIILFGLALVGIVILLNTDLRTIWRELVISVVGRPAASRGSGDGSLYDDDDYDDGDTAELPIVPVSLARVPKAFPASIPPDPPDLLDDEPVINLPTVSQRPISPPVEVVGRGAKSRPALDEPVSPLVVGAGQLALPEAKGSTKPMLQAALAEPLYNLPPLLNLQLYESVMPNQQELSQKAKRIEETLTAFKVDARVREINPGAAVTQFALEPGPGVKVRAIKILENDLALALAATSIAIETPIPGQPRVGIVIPNKTIATVGLRETMESKEFSAAKVNLPMALGRDVNGRYIVADMTKMPHLLIAGSTGSGKSVCINAIISTFLLTRSPDELKLVMIDPKMVELVGYNGIPHLKSPVVIEMDKVVGTLRKALTEMERRYQLFSRLEIRNIDGYRAKRLLDPTMENLPYLVIIIDELADLMMTDPGRGGERDRATGADGPRDRYPPDHRHAAALGGCADWADQGQLPGPDRLHGHVTDR